MKNQYSKELALAKILGLKAGKIMLKHFGKAKTWKKHDKTPVTEADIAINDLFVKEIQKTFSDHSIVGEEQSSIKDSEYVWVCDPIDGTSPYARGIPISVSSLALVHNGVPVVGVVCDPFSKKLYWAAKGAGAFLNGKKMQVSSTKLGYNARIDVEWWPEAPYDLDSALHDLAISNHPYTLHFGSTIQAFMLVANGQLEATLFSGVTAHDVASGKIIVEEAGGKVTDVFGEEQRYDQNIKGAVVSNAVMHKKLIKAIRPYC